MLSLQDKYLQSIDDLKRDLGDFKKKMENENQIIRNGFMSSSFKNDSLNQNYPKNSAEIRPPPYPDSQLRNIKSDSNSNDYNMTLPNHYQNSL